jgi:hypothetical protein
MRVELNTIFPPICVPSANVGFGAGGQSALLGRSGAFGGVGRSGLLGRSGGLLGRSSALQAGYGSGGGGPRTVDSILQQALREESQSVLLRGALHRHRAEPQPAGGGLGGLGHLGASSSGGSALLGASSLRSGGGASSARHPTGAEAEAQLEASFYWLDKFRAQAAPPLPTRPAAGGGPGSGQPPLSFSQHLASQAPPLAPPAPFLAAPPTTATAPLGPRAGPSPPLVQFPFLEQPLAAPQVPRAAFESQGAEPAFGGGSDGEDEGASASV